jgi:hypothetical protein
MNELRDRLKRADPVAHESPPSPADVRRMRVTVLSAVEESQPALPRWHRTAWALAAIAGVSVIVGIDRWSEPSQSPSDEQRATRVDVEMAQTTSPRQMQFQTPGGTRVIWVFNPDFQP